MSLLQFDGFECETNISGYYTTQSSNTSGGITAADNGTKRTGSYSMKFGRLNTGGSNDAQICFYRDWTSPSTNQVTVGFGFKQSLSASDRTTKNQDFLYVGSQDSSTSGGQTVQRGIRLRWRQLTDKRIEILDGAEQSLGIGASVIYEGQWYYFQLQVCADSINGRAKLLIGNQVELDITGINTQITNNLITRVLQQIQSNLQTQTDYVNIDDIYILDSTGPPMNDFLGPVQIYGSVPSSIGDVSDFGYTGAANALASINEISASGGEYVYSDSTAKKLLVNTNDFTFASNVSVLGIRVHDQAMRSDLGSGFGKYRFVLRDINDAEYETADNYVYSATSWLFHYYTFDKDPITNKSQTNQMVNDLQIGQRISRID